MEVHHPHHPTHKKKWSEYIIEFVMLFTAVTLGFIAENIREHDRVIKLLFVFLFIIIIRGSLDHAQVGPQPKGNIIKGLCCKGRRPFLFGVILDQNLHLKL